VRRQGSRCTGEKDVIQKKKKGERPCAVEVEVAELELGRKRDLKPEEEEWALIEKVLSLLVKNCSAQARRGGGWPGRKGGASTRWKETKRKRTTAEGATPFRESATQGW